MAGMAFQISSRFVKPLIEFQIQMMRLQVHDEEHGGTVPARIYSHFLLSPCRLLCSLRVSFLPSSAGQIDKHDINRLKITFSLPKSLLLLSRPALFGKKVPCGRKGPLDYDLREQVFQRAIVHRQGRCLPAMASKEKAATRKSFPPDVY